MSPELVAATVIASLVGGVVGFLLGRGTKEGNGDHSL